MRDSQRLKVHRTEELHSCFKTGEFENIQAVEKYVKNLIGQEWFKREWDHLSYVTFGSRGKYPWGCMKSSSGGEMILPPGTRFEMIVLHQLAHIVTQKAPWHGREFCQNYLRLIRNRLGAEAEKEMKDLFNQHKVKYKQARTMTPEQKEAAAKRLAAHRTEPPAVARKRVLKELENDGRVHQEGDSELPDWDLAGVAGCWPNEGFVVGDDA